MPDATPLLELRGISRSFGGVHAVQDVSLQVHAGQVVALIGPNGAGKSTLFHTVSGLVKPDAGQILLRGQEISALPTEKRVALGVACTFQNLRLFPDMTVRETMLTSAYHRMAGRWSTLLGSLVAAPQRLEVQARDVHEVLGVVGLADALDVDVGALSYGAKKRLEMARALATHPAVILLDEPVAGMNATEKNEMAVVVRRMREQGLGVLLVEHDMHFVMSLADRVVVMNFGQRIAEGPPDQVQRDPAVQAAYLGAEID
jgi:ABC-type branched-subunit amino acid transport system ATPase component